MLALIPIGCCYKFYLIALCIVLILVVLLTCAFIVCRTVAMQAASGAFHYLGVYCMAIVLIGLCMIKFYSYLHSVDLQRLSDLISFIL